MKKLLPALLLFLATTPLFAQGRSLDVMGFITYVDLSGGDVILGEDSANLSFDTDQGYGLGVNFFITRRLSAELTASEIKPEGRVSSGDGYVDTELDMLPITAVAQYHFNPEGKLDPYVGMGIAYIIFDEFSSKDPNVDFSGVDVRNDYGAVFNAGLSYEIRLQSADHLGGSRRAVLGGRPSAERALRGGVAFGAATMFCRSLASLGVSLVQYT